MDDKKRLFIIDILKNVVAVYFSTFFVFYFFQAANYEILPLVKYYLIDYIITGLAFILIRKGIKKNSKIPYFQMGIALESLYIALIMLLKENIVNFIALIGAVKGFANAFYYFPRNILESEKVDNKDRQAFEGKISTINEITAIIIPIILGVLLTYFTYTDLGKIFFLLFIVMFVIAFKMKDKIPKHTEFNIKKFRLMLKQNKDIKISLLIPFLAGFSYSSGVMTLIVTILKIGIFKTNFNLGLVDGTCAFLSLLVCFMYVKIIRKDYFGKILTITGILSLLSLLSLAIFNNEIFFIIYLIIRFSCIIIIGLISDTLVINLTNHKDIKNILKEEYYCAREIMYSISRSLGYIVLLIMSLISTKYVSYLLILPGFALLFETVILYRLAKKEV